MERKRQIIRLALEYIQSHGYNNFSYLDLSRRLGIQKASIHYHFPRKVDLGLAVLEKIQDQNTQTAELLRQFDGDARDKLHHYLNLAFNSSKNGRHICPISSLTSQLTAIPQPMRDRLHEIQTNEIQIVMDILDEGLKDGTINFQGNCKQQAQLIIAAVKGAQQMTRLLGNGVLTKTVQQLSLNLTTSTTG